MSKVANVAKDKLRNGMLLGKGYRVKYVSDDKEFIIIMTNYRARPYVGIYIDYREDGAYVDENRTPRNLDFKTVEDCKSYFNSQPKKEKGEVNEEPVVNAQPEKVERFPIIAPVGEFDKMEDMRKAFIEKCEKSKIQIDKTCIKQYLNKGDFGIVSGYINKNAVVVGCWYRANDENGARKYSFAIPPYTKYASLIDGLK